MLWGAPYYTTTTNPHQPAVFHTYSECPYGMRINQTNLRDGTGSRTQLCKRCCALSQEEWSWRNEPDEFALLGMLIR